MLRSESWRTHRLHTAHGHGDDHRQTASQDAIEKIHAIRPDLTGIPGHSSAVSFGILEIEREIRR